MKVIITGRPGIGKTTVFSKTIELLRSKGITVGGFVCPEIRRGGIRVGFDIVDILSGERSPLARVSGLSSSDVCVARVGKYCVLEDAVTVGCNAIDVALRAADVIGIDEVGPMELKLAKLRRCMEKVLKDPQVTALIVLHRRLTNNVGSLVKGERRLFWITESNRVELPNLIVDIIVNSVKKKNEVQ